MIVKSVGAIVLVGAAVLLWVALSLKFHGGEMVKGHDVGASPIEKWLKGDEASAGGKSRDERLTDIWLLQDQMGIGALIFGIVGVVLMVSQRKGKNAASAKG